MGLKSNVFHRCAWAQREGSLGLRFQFHQGKHRAWCQQNLLQTQLSTWRTEVETGAMGMVCGDHLPADCWCDRDEKRLSVRALVLPSHFCSTKSKMGMDQSGPRRNPAMLSTTHSTSSSSSAAIPPGGEPRTLRPDPLSQLRPFGRREPRANG